MLPSSSRPTSLPNRRVHSAVPTVAPFHQVNVLDQKPMGACLCRVGGGSASSVHPLHLVALANAEFRCPSATDFENADDRFTGGHRRQVEWLRSHDSRDRSV